MSGIETPQSNKQPWEGLHGRRWTGIGIVSGGNFEGADGWLETLGMAPRLPGESWIGWDTRTKGGQDLGSLMLEEAAGEQTDGNEIKQPLAKPPVYESYDDLSQYPLQGLRAVLLRGRATNQRAELEALQVEIASRLDRLGEHFPYPEQRDELANIGRQAQEYLEGESHGTEQAS